MFERGKGKTNVQKGAFGQALAQVLLSDEVSFVVPPYIGSALQHIVGT
jgi:putative ATP-dependent endonuclease of OLD family